MIDWAGRVVPFPAELVTRYRAEGLWGDNTIATELHRTASRFPDREAVVASAGRYTYRELDERTDQVALGLIRLGFEPGNRVVLQLTNRPETVLAWYGLLKAGLIPVCTLAAHRAHEIGAISRLAEAVGHLVDGGTSFDLVSFAVEQQHDHPTLRHILTVGADPDAKGVRIEDLYDVDTAAAARAAVRARQSHVDPDDVAVFQLSGGTTGVPKVIPRLHAEYWYNARAFAEAWEWDETTRDAHLIPLVHNAGVVCGMHAVHSVGGCLIVGTAAPSEALPLLVAEHPTDILIGHSHYTWASQPEFRPVAERLRTVIFSGAKVPPALFEAVESAGAVPGQLFGMGEGLCMVTGRSAPRQARLSTVGAPISPLDEIRVLEPGTEDEVAKGEVGELACRGPYTLHGYYDLPGHNAVAFTSDGFYRTGDLVAIRTIEGGCHVSVEGRIKDLINRGGEKISAEEVELLLLQHPGIQSAAVVAMPDERLGERACAYLVATDQPIDLVELRRHLDILGVAKFKWPERLEWRTALPLTPVGKLDKKRLSAEIGALVTAEQRTR